MPVKASVNAQAASPAVQTSAVPVDASEHVTKVSAATPGQPASQPLVALLSVVELPAAHTPALRPVGPSEPVVQVPAASFWQLASQPSIASLSVFKE